MHSLKLIFVLMLAALLAGLAGAQQPALSLDRSGGPARVGITGVLGQEYILQTTTNNMASWDFLLKFSLTNSPQNWFDASSTNPARFYRAYESTEPVEVASDFRLIDHLGRSRSLYYYQNEPSIQTNTRAITLIFTGNGCSKIRDLIPTIKALTNRFTPQGVLFWLIDSNQQDNRSNILVEATSLGISNGPPILHDAAQVVARAFSAGTTPEAVAIDTADFTVFYRGAIDDRLASNVVVTTQSYLSNALVNFLAGRPVSPSRTVPGGCTISLKPRFPSIDYATEIAPLLAAKCVRCHSPGNIAPWAMTNYNIVAGYAYDIRREVMAARMPPWHADPYYGVFTNDFSLSTDQTAKLLQWINDGSPRGTGPDPLATATTRTNYPYGWPTNLGPPDLIYHLPVQNINATGLDNGGNYRDLYVTNNLIPTNAWFRAAIIRPGNTKSVHHVLAFNGSSIQGMGLDGYFAAYAPGAEPLAYPPNTGRYLTNGEVLQFQMHYITIGHATNDQTDLGLYFAPTPPAYPLQTKSAVNPNFGVFNTVTIAANTNAFQITAQYPVAFPSPTTLPTNIVLYELDPHMHLRGASYQYDVVYNAGHVPAREVLLAVPSYAFGWQTPYRFTTPKYIPKGSYIICTAYYDNSTQNGDLMSAYAASSPSEPKFLPNRAVPFGKQTFDEMMIGYLNYVEVSGPPP